MGTYTSCIIDPRIADADMRVFMTSGITTMLSQGVPHLGTSVREDI